jgi:catechol 2,3-dioxygenase-like lactoylglutathione lyase family enzyme
MLDHTGIVVTDIKRARAFYDAIAKPLGLKIKDMQPEFFLLGRGPDNPTPYLWIGTLHPSYWKEGSRPGINQMHVAFKAKDRSTVDAFYKAAMEAGGRDNGEPGPRDFEKNYYAAFVLDPDGNNIEACYRGK